MSILPKFRFHQSLYVGVVTYFLAFCPAYAQENAPEAGGQPVARVDVERTTRAGAERLIGTYLTLSKDCKIGENPKFEVVSAPKKGKVYNRPNAINLRQVPGAPRVNCIGVSPNGLGVYYRADRKFKGEDHVLLRFTYPTGVIREVNAKIIVQ